ncbi:hypothetical protein QBC46DRAFT_358433 [Diplogelasinospora grovesii]|uniref:Uncharacterized protein n=1 Tax=Diplogelasinospora grovesii TaxID=303347 RepID=A0AAN6MYU0_9PEZI|nr:hypothetical protein QBC46DRAFT_358433 [Diplogelasinospora grovesii]
MALSRRIGPSVTDPGLWIPSDAVRSRPVDLDEVTARLLDVSLKSRSYLITEFVRGTWDYQGAKGDVERHSILLRWILEQVPLVEAELNESKASKGNSHTRHGTKRRLVRE